MNRFLHGVVRAAVETFDFPEPVLEVGSYLVEGQEDLCDIRRYFPGRRYLGLDFRQGPGVDVVGSIEKLPFASRSIGTVVALSTFEHVRHFWRGFDEVYRVLRPDGAFLLACPFHFHIHCFPSDYWRFTPEAFRLLLDRYPSKLIGWHGPRTRPANVWGVAFREESPGIAPGQEQQYRRLLNQYAREPLPPLRRLRYQLGRLLCGSRPFAPWLAREKWDVEFINS